MLRKVIRALSSLRLTLVLLVLLSVIFTLSTLIPQRSLLKQKLFMEWMADNPTLVQVLDFLKLTDIFVAPYTLAIWVVFFLNLAVVMWKRLPLIRKKASLDGVRLSDPKTSKLYSARTSLPMAADATLKSVQDAFDRARFDTVGEGDRFYAVKNRRSPWATLGFHLSFFVIMFGGLTVYYTRFVSEVSLAEGETFTGELSQYPPNVRFPALAGLPKAHFTVEKIEPRVEGWTPTGVTMTLRDAQGIQHNVEINQPYEVGNSAFGVQNVGVAPLIVIHDENGNEVDGAYIRMNVLNDRVDTFELQGLEFRAEFYPHFEVVDGVESNLSREMKNPVFRLTPIEAGAPPGRLIGVGGKAAFGKVTLEVREMRYWAKIFVRKQHGIWVVFTGFLLGSLALCWRLLLYRREYMVGVEGQGSQRVLWIAGRAELYKALFEDEFEATVARLTAGCVAAPPSAESDA